MNWCQVKRNWNQVYSWMASLSWMPDERNVVLLTCLDWHRGADLLILSCQSIVLWYRFIYTLWLTSIVIVLAMVNQTLVYLLGSFYLFDRLVFPYVFGPFWKWQYCVKLSSTQVTACLPRIKCPNIHDNYLPNLEFSVFDSLFPYFVWRREYQKYWLHTC